jgi:hypothetical protein
MHQIDCLKHIEVLLQNKMFDAAINVNQFMLERGHKSVQSSTLLDLQRKWAFHLFIHERDYKYSANIFQAWS